MENTKISKEKETVNVTFPRHYINVFSILHGI